MNDTNQAPSSGAQAINLLESLGLWAYVAIGALLAGGILLLSISFFQKDPATRDGYGKLGSLLLFSGSMSVFSIRFLDYVSSPAPSDPDSPAAKRVKTELIGCTTAITILLGMAFIVIQRYTSANTDGRVLGILAMWGGACMLMGVLCGFLFGIPKELETSQLEQIADWITKIIVGVGLTQLSKIPHKLRLWAEIIASEAGTGTVAAPIHVVHHCPDSLFPYGWVPGRIPADHSVPGQLEDRRDSQATADDCSRGNRSRG